MPTEMGYKCDPIKVRYKTLTHGNRSIYLDYKLADGSRKQEYLKMYLIPGRSAEVKRRNEFTMRAVANIKAQRLTNIAWNKEANDNVEHSRRLLFDVIDEYTALRTRRGTKSARLHYGNIKNHIARINPDIRMWEVNVEFINTLACDMMHNGRNSAGQPLAKGTVTNILLALSSVLRYAVRKGMISSNPVELYDMRKVKGTVNKRTYLTSEELKCLAETPCCNEGYKQLFLFACFVGLRFGDLITLRWREVVEEGVHTHIEKMMNKTRHMVYVPLNKLALAYLPHRSKGESLVFARMPKSVNHINEALKRWAQEAGLDKNVTFYTARHTFATLSLTQGADLYSVSQLLGHRDIKTTEGYAEIIDKKKEEAVYMIDNLFKEFLHSTTQWLNESKQHPKILSVSAPSS